MTLAALIDEVMPHNRVTARTVAKNARTSDAGLIHIDTARAIAGVASCTVTPEPMPFVVVTFITLDA